MKKLSKSPWLVCDLTMHMICRDNVLGLNELLKLQLEILKDYLILVREYVLYQLLQYSYVIVDVILSLGLLAVDKYL